jgi:hypothetical protein
MNNRDQQEVNRTLQGLRVPGLGPDFVARGLSALYRASNSKTQGEILALALAAPGVTSSRDWIV